MRALSTLAIGAALAAAACGTYRMPMAKSDDVPGSAMATLKETDEGTKIKLKVKDLKPAEELRAGATAYVAWAVPRGGDEVKAEKLGTLDPSGDGDDSLEALTTLRDFDVVVTAERDGDATIPRGKRLLWARVDSRRMASR